MMKCAIQWIDEKGRFTPDTNQAVGMAHFHRPIFDHRGITRYTDDIKCSFPICAEHYARVQHNQRYESGGAWSFTLFEEQSWPPSKTSSS